MIGLIPYILILMVISAVVMTFIIRVLLKQVSLFKYKIHDQRIRHFRVILFLISLTIIVMGLIPMGINVLTLIYPTGRPAIIPPVSFIYSIVVHLQALFLAYLLWRIYRLANQDFNNKDE